MAISRRLRYQQQRMLKLGVILMLVTAAIGLLSFLLIIPGVVRLVGGLSADANLTPTDNLAIQLPILSVPPLATNSAKIKLSGYSSPDASVVILRDGQQIAEVQTSQSGEFEQEVELTTGENTFSAYTKQGQQESEVGAEVQIDYDATAPEVAISEPSSGQQIQGKKNQLLKIVGKTEAGVRLLLNDRLVFVTQSGEFNTEWRLNNGDNNLKFVATDRAGNQTTTELLIGFRE